MKEFLKNSPEDGQFVDRFGYLVFDDSELANSIQSEKKTVTRERRVSSNMTSNPTAILSTRSELEEEKAQWLQIQLRQLKTMT